MLSKKGMFVCVLMALFLVVFGGYCLGFSKILDMDQSDGAYETGAESREQATGLSEVYSYASLLDDRMGMQAAGEREKSEERLAEILSEQSREDADDTDGAAYGAVPAAEWDIAVASSGDQDYILKGINDPEESGFDPEITPDEAFQRDPEYADRDLYGSLQEGDIIIETKNEGLLLGGILNSPGHAAYIYDVDKSSSGGTYIQTIEAVAGGVQFGFLDDGRILDFGVVIVRTNGASADVIEKASEFVYAQLNEPYCFSLSTAKLYFFDFMDPYDESADKWYCSELVNAAYNYAYFSDSDYFSAVNSTGNVLPADLLYYSRTVYVPYGNYLDIRVSKTEEIDDGYVLEIYNMTGSDLTVEYNAKRCWTADAEAWSSLDDIETFTLKKSSYKTVEVYNNLLADAVAVSCAVGNVRYITYGNSMMAGSYSLCVFKVSIGGEGA